MSGITRGKQLAPKIISAVSSVGVGSVGGFASVFYWLEVVASKELNERRLLPKWRWNKLRMRAPRG